MNDSLPTTIPDISTSYFFYNETENVNIPNQFALSILENGTISSLHGLLNPSIKSIYHFINYSEKKEELYLTAVDNLIKKNEFLQLTIQLDQELISEEEFENELEINESKYLIKMKDSFNEDYYSIACDILPKLNRNITSDEMSELFSIPLDKINCYIDSRIIKENG